MDTSKSEHHGRDHLMTGAGLICEFLAARYGNSILAWAGGIFLFLAFVNYTRRYLSGKSRRWRYTSYVGGAVVLTFVTLVVTGVRLWPRREQLMTTPQSPTPAQQSQGLPQQPITNLNPEKKKPPKRQTSAARNKLETKDLQITPNNSGDKSPNVATNTSPPSVGLVETQGNRTKIYVENNLIGNTAGTPQSLVSSRGDDDMICVTDNLILTGKEAVDAGINIAASTSVPHHTVMNWWWDVLDRYSDFANKKNIAGLQTYFEDIEERKDAEWATLFIDQQKANHNELKTVLDGLVEKATKGMATDAAGV